MFFERAPAPQLRFLVVDDTDDIRDVVSRMIERAGQVASTARDGLEAVEMLQRESFDVMLLDLAMPRMGGVEVVRWLRANPDVAPQMRVVVLSAGAGEHKQTLLDLGVRDVLPKPFRMHQINDLAAETLAGVTA